MHMCANALSCLDKTILLKAQGEKKNDLLLKFLRGWPPSLLSAAFLHIQMVQRVSRLKGLNHNRDKMECKCQSEACEKNRDFFSSILLLSGKVVRVCVLHMHMSRWVSYCHNFLHFIVCYLYTLTDLFPLTEFPSCFSALHFQPPAAPPPPSSLFLFLPG